MKTKRPTPELYLAFPKAIAALRDRIGATENEIACWLFFDQIKAYAHVHTFQPPPEISLMGVALTGWTQADKSERPYLNALEGAFFLISDIEKFEPPTRYISLEDLVSRWIPHRRSQEATISFILSRINQSRLIDFVPGLGQTELSSNLRPAPPSAWAMFNLAEVKAIEASDFLEMGMQPPGQLLNSVDPLAPAMPEKPVEQSRTKQRDQEREIVKIVRQLGHEPMELPKHANGRRGVRADVFDKITIADDGLFSTLKTRELAWDRCIDIGEIKFVEQSSPPQKTSKI